MGKSAGSDQLADIQKAKFNLSILEKLKEAKDEILKQAEDGYIKDKSKRKVSQLTSIINTAGDRRGNILLIQCSSELSRSFRPLYPENFPDPLLIDMYFQQYEEAFLTAVGLHAQKWDVIFQEASKSMYASRLEDKMDNVTDIIQKFKKEKE